MAHRAAWMVVVAAAALVARGEGGGDAPSSVAAVNGVVVHGVDTELLAARVREVDQKAAEGDAAAAAKGLAELTGGDLAPLLEEGEGVWISAQESVLQRIAKLPPDGLAAYRRALDGPAQTILATAAARPGSTPARDAVRYAFTTHGARLLLLVADQRLAQGDLPGAQRVLEDLLRLLPDHAAPADLAAAASRLAALLVVQGDRSGVRGVAADLPAAALDAPSPLRAGTTLRDELARAAELAAARDPTAAGPDAPLRVAAELPFGPTAARVPGGRGGETGLGPEGRPPGTLREHPLAIGTPESPALLLRLQQRATAKVAAIGVTRPPGAAAAMFRPLWSWPSSPSEEPRRSFDVPFAPARLGGDFVVLTWPAPPRTDGRPSARAAAFEERGEERHQLVVLSISAEGKLVDERGRDRTEDGRGDADPELESLSFAGRPVVDGSSVYVAAVRGVVDPDAREPATELHVCRFDFVPSGNAGRLHLRWRRHVADGGAITAAYRATQLQPPGLVLPSAPLVRAGRVYLASNTGAVACLDAATGRPEWVETYERYGPSPRMTILETELASWDDVPPRADGPYVFAAPRDAENVLQFRRAPRRARSVRVEDFALAGPNGTLLRPSRLLADLVATEVPAVRDGVLYVAGRVVREQGGAGAATRFMSPLAAFSLETRSWRFAEIQEHAPAGGARLVRGALLFPTPKTVYRVPLGDFEGPPQVLWTNDRAGDGPRGQDRIGHLVPDGARLWTVTPSRVLLLEPK